MNLSLTSKNAITQEFEEISPKFGIYMKNGSGVDMNDKIGRSVGRSMVMPRLLAVIQLI